MATITPPLPARRIASPVALHLWHLTSLDAVTVAVTWTLAFAWAAHLRLPWWPPAVVGLSAWSFYIADRLFDARRASSPLRPRHHFHWRHRRIFIPLAIACALAAFALVLWKMPLHAEMRDSLIAAAALAYFAGVHARAGSLTQQSTSWASSWMSSLRQVMSRTMPRAMPKEFLVAIVFTAACSAPVLTRSVTRLPLVPVLAAFIALAWLNCHAIESWESEGTRSVNRAARWLTGAVLACTAAAAVLLHSDRISLLLAAAAASAALLGVLDHQRQRLAPMTLRVLADLVLLTPLALITRI